MLVSGIIKDIQDYDMDVSLPNGITGYLPITNISNSYTELLRKLTSGEDAAIDEVWQEDSHTPIPTSTTQPLLSAIKGAFTHNEIQVKQECIPVGCVPPALYRTGGGGGLCQRGSLSSRKALPKGVSDGGGLSRGMSLSGRPSPLWTDKQL